MPPILRIATRQSQLALWQARHVQTLLKQTWPDMEVELLPLRTEGDQRLDRSLADIGGKGLFLKELESAMMRGEADLAVHSLKDVPAELPEGFALPAVLAAASPHDAFVANDYQSPEQMPAGAVVGTSSLRRAAMIKHLRPDLRIAGLRGNVQTRLRQLDDGHYDAIVLACAGLERLGLADRISCELTPEQSLPAIGQGVVGIEIRADDQETARAIAPLDDPYSHVRIIAERAVNRRLAGSCHLPIAAHARHDGKVMDLQACVGRPDGSQMVADSIQGPVEQAQKLGHTLAERLLAAGADKILADLS